MRHDKGLGKFSNRSGISDSSAIKTGLPKEGVGLIKSFQLYWPGTNSANRSFITQRMKLSPQCQSLAASRSGLDTGEDTLAVVATKIAELITV